MTQFTLSAFADEASPEFDRQIAALHRKHISLMEIRGVDGKGILDLTDEELDVVEKRDFKQAFFFAFAFGRSVIEPSNTSAARPTDS